MHLNVSSLAVEIVVKGGIAFLQAKLGKVLLRDAYLYWLNLVSLAKTFSIPFARFVRRAMSGLVAFSVGCAASAYGYED
jgi:hypothetical protein